MSNGKGKLPQCEPVYIAAGCNRYSNVADVRESDGLVAYGAGKLVALWNSEVRHESFLRTGGQSDALNLYSLHIGYNALRCPSDSPRPHRRSHICQISEK